MRWIVGGKTIERSGASTSQMGRFETELLATYDNLAVLADLSGIWIDRVNERRPPKAILLDLVSSDSPTYGDQEGTADWTFIARDRHEDARDKSTPSPSNRCEPCASCRKGSTWGIPAYDGSVF